MILMGVAPTAPAPQTGSLPVSREPVTVKMNRGSEHVSFPLVSSLCACAFQLKTHYVVIIIKKKMFYGLMYSNVERSQKTMLFKMK